MSSGGGSIQYWEYHGTIAGYVCAGPVDVLEEILVDGDSVWRGPLARGGATNYSTITIASNRVLRFYWGTETQVGDPALQSSGNGYGDAHPDYRGSCYLVLVDFFFGRERTSAPNIEVVVGRRPKQAVFTNGAADLHDGQASALGSLADFFTDHRYGLSLPAGRFDGGSWFGASDALYLDGAHEKSYVSPLLNSQAPARNSLADLALLSGLWLRHNPTTDLIEAGTWPRGSSLDVGSLPILTADDFTERPKLKASGWSEVETGWAVAFTDRDRAFKESSEKYDDLRALRIVGEHRRTTLQRPWITRRRQALGHAIEYGGFKGAPTLAGSLTVRREKALNLRPGDLVRVDIDPEPGGPQLLQVCRILERTIPHTGPIKLRIEADLSFEAVPFVPEADVPPAPQALILPEVSDFRLFELPPALTGGVTGKLGLLAKRPHGMVTGVRLHYCPTADGDFRFVGVQELFALKSTPLGGWSESYEGPVSIALDDSPDHGLLESSPGLAAARDNALLLIVLERDPNGQISTDENDFPALEIFSISEIELTAPSVYSVTALRARLGTLPRACLPLNSEAWIISRAGLVPFSHGDFPGLVTVLTTAYFRCQPFNLFVSRDLSDCSNQAVYFPFALPFAPVVSWLSPAAPETTFAAPPASALFKGTVTDADRNLVSLALILRRSDGSEESLLGLPLAPCGRYDFEHEVSFSQAGRFTLTARAQDASGRITDSSRAIVVAGPSNKVATPAIVPASGFYRTTRTATLSCATAGATIEYVLTASGAAAPASGWITYQPANPPTVSLTRRIWARAYLSGYTDSDKASADYWRDSSGEDDWRPSGNEQLP